jgi:LmbE family N-acetylglucosaminyl deacetylase
VKRGVSFILALALLVVFPIASLAQSLPETVEAIDRARIVTRILYVTAHPDDEASSLLTYLARGLDADVALLTLTHGEGGQNALGPEQGPELAILRTEELQAATRQYGVTHLFFTRAPDFGYSKSAEQTLKIWDGIVLEDMVRVIRVYRPQIIINGWGGIQTAHGHHQASGILTPRALAAAADPKAFPQQLAEGLRPWKTPLLLENRRGQADASANAYRIPSDQISPLWGKSYDEIGREGLTYHRSQGLPGFLDAPFLRRPVYLLRPDGGRLDPADLAVPLRSLASDSKSIQERFENADQLLSTARDAALRLDWPAAAQALARAGGALIALRDQLTAKGSSEQDDLRWNIDCARERIDHALALAAALQIEPRPDRSELVAGEDFAVDVEWRYRPDVPIETLKATLKVPQAWRVTQQKLGDAQATGMRFAVAVPADAHPPVSPNDAILPRPEPLVRAQLRGTLAGYTFSVEKAAMARRVTSTQVDVLPLDLVPAVTLTVERREMVMPRNGSRSAPIEMRVRYHGTASADIAVGVDAPAGWSMEPPPTLHFSGPGEQLTSLRARSPDHLQAGGFTFKPYAKRGNEVFRTSLEPLPSLPTQHWSEPAEATLHVLDIQVPANLRVGYVAAENDPVPQTLPQLGIQVELLDETALAFQDLSRFDAIVVGIRAYELRADLTHENHRLLDYVAKGGTLVVQYQRDFVWNKILPSPFPATMPQPTSRTTDANSPVRFLAPQSPLLNFPNKISQEDFQGWVQERGSYYWGSFDPRYQALLAVRDPGEEEALGALVYARDGKGFYIYTGLSFFRQLPAGVPGAYRLFVNLLSQSRAGSATHESK